MSFSRGAAGGCVLASDFSNRRQSCTRASCLQVPLLVSSIVLPIPPVSGKGYESQGN